MVNAMLSELNLQKDFFAGEILKSIYFGGGTPSVLSATDLTRFLDQITQHFHLADKLEITLEANPDDLSLQYLKDIRSAGINRLSIGIQSFYDEDLKWMNRSHDAQQAFACLNYAVQAGFINLNADLIYGYPLLDEKKWLANMEKIFSGPATHLSAYSMTVEHKTALFHQIIKGKTQPMDEAQSARHFELLLETCAKYGWEQYEISNFCRDGLYSEHNSAYWKGDKYLGIGPSAHSFDGSSRFWNISNNAAYLKALTDGIIPAESEKLSLTDRYNERIMTGLRTKWGVNLHQIEKTFGTNYRSHLEKGLTRYKDYYSVSDDGTITLNQKGMLLADRIASEMFF